MLFSLYLYRFDFFFQTIFSATQVSIINYNVCHSNCWMQTKGAQASLIRISLCTVYLSVSLLIAFAGNIYTGFNEKFNKNCDADMCICDDGGYATGCTPIEKKCLFYVRVLHTNGLVKADKSRENVRERKVH